MTDLLIVRSIECAGDPGCHQKTDKQYQSFDFLVTEFSDGIATYFMSAGGHEPSSSE